MRDGSKFSGMNVPVSLTSTPHLSESHVDMVEMVSTLRAEPHGVAAMAVSRISSSVCDKCSLAHGD